MLWSILRWLLPIGVGLLQLVILRVALSQHRVRLAVQRHRRAFLEERRAAAGARWLEVRVAGDATEWRSLGSSVEKPEDMRATPVLNSDAVELLDAEDHRYELAAGAPLEVLVLPGARRNLIEAVTTLTGVEQRYSFELSGGTRFWLLASPRRRRAEDPYRDGHAGNLEPFEKRFQVRHEIEQDQKEPVEPGCGWFAAWVVFALATCGAAAYNLAYVGGVLWAVALGIAVLSAIGHATELEAPNLADEDAEVRRRVEADHTRE